MSRIVFEEIDNDELLAKYLKQVLSRHTTANCLFHYAKFSTLQRIYENNTLRLNKPEMMNDKAEADSIKKNKLENRLFYTCFTLTSESAEMWKMYTATNDGCIIGINFELAKKMLNYPVYSSIEYNDETMKITGELGFSAVAYFTEKEDSNSRLKCMSVNNKGYSTSYESAVLAGMIKSDFWRFEKEARLILRTNQDYDNNYVELKLEKEFWNDVSVVISPFTTIKKERMIKEWCDEKRIKCCPSKFARKVNFERSLLEKEDTHDWIVKRFDSLFGKTKAGTKKISYGEIVAKIVSYKLDKWYSTNTSISEYEEWLQDEMCSILKNLDENKVRQFVRDVVDYLKV